MGMGNTLPRKTWLSDIQDIDCIKSLAKLALNRECSTVHLACRGSTPIRHVECQVRIESTRSYHGRTFGVLVAILAPVG